jgi:hypothetical protein
MRKNNARLGARSGRGVRFRERTPAQLYDFDDPHCGFDDPALLGDGNWGECDCDSGS